MSDISDFKKQLDKMKKEAEISKVNATIPEAIPEVKKKAEEIKKPPYIPFPERLHKDLMLISKPYKLSKKDIVEETPERIFYKKEMEQGQLFYDFGKKSSDEGKDLNPNLSLMEKVFRGTWKSALEQKKVNPTFTLGEKAKALGYSKEQIEKGGDIFENIEKQEENLANARYIFNNKKRGKEKQRIIGSLYSNLVINGEGKGKTFTPTINLEYIKTINIATGTIKGRFISYPTYLLSDTTLTHYDKNWLSWLYSIKGMEGILNVETLLKEKLSISKNYYKRKEYCIETLDRCLILARREGFIIEIDDKGFGTHYSKYLEKYSLEKLKDIFLKEKLKKQKIQNLIGDVRKWQLKIKHKDSFRKKGKKKFSLNGSEEALAHKIINWGYNPHFDFRIKTPKEETLNQVKNVIKKLGKSKVEKIFNETANSYNPFHTTQSGKKINSWVLFWNEVKEELKNRP